jgi:hypothetical protein
MSDAAPPASAREALGMLRSAMGYLAAADATAMAAETQARMGGGPPHPCGMPDRGTPG